MKYLILICFLFFCTNDRCIKIDDSVPDDYEIDETRDTVCIEGRRVAEHTVMYWYQIDTCEKD